MSESTQTSWAHLCDLKRCSCVVFFLKQEEKTWQTGLKFSLPTPPPPPPHTHTHPHRLLLSTYTRDMRNPVLHGKKHERTLGLFVKSFLPAFREKQHRNIFSHHTGRLARFGWILTYLKISVEMAVTWFLPGAIQFMLWMMRWSAPMFILKMVMTSSAPLAWAILIFLIRLPLPCFMGLQFWCQA